MNRFAGKTALITGAASGIGAAACTRLLAEGARVIALDREPQAPAGIADQIEAYLPVDLSKSVPAALLQDSAVDILVNAAGVLRRADIRDHTVQDWNDTLAVNVRAVYRLCALFAAQRIHRQLPGAIVNVCSIESFTALPRHAAYTASKTAVLMLTRSFALELAPHGVRVNAIAPGVTATGMNRSLREDPQAAAGLSARIPLGRFADPSEQAAAIAFLASEDASYITGSTLAVDGGWLTQ